MTTEHSGRDPVDRLAEEFVSRYRRGERPSASEYAGRYPELADQIGDVLQALVAIEEFSPGRESESSWEPGPRLLGDYRLLREVGRGGMGVVYEAEQVSLDRHVAVKLLPPDPLRDATQLERFHREAQAAAKLHHTNIVPVYGVGEVDGVCYYAMQFIDGRPLDEVLREVRRLREEGQSTASSATLPGLSDTDGRADRQHYYRGVARIGAQVADALAYAHAQGVQHRDIKPSNLLLDAQGTPWITDFGLAKAEGSGELTRAGDVVGTLRYMAPERFDGRSDARSDVYSLGLTLYELLTLRPAFDETDRGRLISQILHDEPRGPRKLDRYIPRDMETVALKAIAKEPDRRYQSAAEMAEDLRRFLSDRPIRARRSRMAEQVRLWARRNPAVATLSLCVGVLALLVAAVLPLTALWHQERNHALVNLGRAEKAERAMGVQAHLAQARAHRHSGRPGQRLQSLDEITRAVALEPGPELLDELRDEAIACLALPDLRVLKEWEGCPPGTIGKPVFTPDMVHYARCDRRDRVSVRRVSDDTEETSLQFGSVGIALMGFSPNGRFLATRSKQPVRTQVWDWRTGSAVVDEPGLRALDFSHDSRLVAISVDPNRIVIYELTGGPNQRRGVPLDAGSAATLITFHPAGSRLAVVNTSRTVRGLSLEGGPVTALTGTHPEAIRAVAWHPNGVLLATGSGNDIYLWDGVTGRPRGVLGSHQAQITSLAFSATGDQLLSRANDGSGRLWDPWDRRMLLTFPGVFAPAGWSDRSLARWNGSQVEHYELIPGREYRTLTSPSQTPLRSSTSSMAPDGRWIATLYGSQLHVWDLTSGRMAAQIDIRLASAVTFHPDGRHLYLSGADGLFRCPFRLDGGTLHLGPLEPLPFEPETKQMIRALTVVRDGRSLAVVSGNVLTILDLENPQGRIQRFDRDAASASSVSPDARWVALRARDGSGVRVWDAQRNPPEPVAVLPDVPRVWPRFSPDGRWLVACTGTGFRAWKVGTWKLGPQIERQTTDDLPPSLSFSQDGRLLALATGNGIIQLHDAVTFRLLVRLQPPEPERQLAGGTSRHFSLSPDGSLLVMLPPWGGGQVWDLQRLREGLREIGLDWN